MTDSKPEAVEPTTDLTAESADFHVESSPVEKKAAPKKAAPARGPVKSSGPSRVVGLGSTDEVSFNRLDDIVSGRSRTRKSLTLHHLQARLAELGYPEAASALDGRYDALTRTAVEKWQKDNGHPTTGELTREQFTAVFDGDTNVTVVA